MTLGSWFSLKVVPVEDDGGGGGPGLLMGGGDCCPGGLYVFWESWEVSLIILAVVPLMADSAAFLLVRQR